MTLNGSPRVVDAIHTCDEALSAKCRGSSILDLDFMSDMKLQRTLFIHYPDPSGPLPFGQTKPDFDWTKLKTYGRFFEQFGFLWHH